MDTVFVLIVGRQFYMQGIAEYEPRMLIRDYKSHLGLAKARQLKKKTINLLQYLIAGLLISMP